MRNAPARTPHEQFKEVASLAYGNESQARDLFYSVDELPLYSFNKTLAARETSVRLTDSALDASAESTVVNACT